MPYRALPLIALLLSTALVARAQDSLTEQLDAELRGIHRNLAEQVVEIVLTGAFQLDPRFDAEPWSLHLSGVVLDAERGTVASYGRTFHEAERIEVRRNGQLFEAVVAGVDTHTGLVLLEVEGLAGQTRAADWTEQTVEPGSLLAVCGGNPDGAFAMATLRGSVSLNRGEHRVRDALCINLGLSSSDIGGLVADCHGLPLGMLIRGYEERPGEQLSPSQLLGQMFADEGVPEELLLAPGSGRHRSYALPGSVIRKAVERIRSQRTVRTGWLGIQVQTLDADAGTEMGIDQGLIVVRIFTNGPAEASELQLGDVITSLSEPEAELDELGAFVRGNPGGTLRLNVLRETTQHTIIITIGERVERVPHGPSED